MKLKSRVLLSIALCALTVPAAAQTRPVQAKAAPVASLVKAVDIPYQTFTLANGLRVVVHTDRKAPVVAVSYRCASSAGFGGIYVGLDGDVPVVKVAVTQQYQPLFGGLGFNSSALCLAAESEAPVTGL